MTAKSLHDSKFNFYYTKRRICESHIAHQKLYIFFFAFGFYVKLKLSLLIFIVEAYFFFVAVGEALMSYVHKSRNMYLAACIIRITEYLKTFN